MANYKRTEYRQVITGMMMLGYSIRETAYLLKIARQTVKRYRDMERPATDKCRCGKPAQHNGWCAWRYQRSKPRQEFMRKWHDAD